MWRLLVCLIGAVVLAGCVGTMLPGRMYASPNGQILKFEIETSYGQGKMTAFNDQTGEKFTGEYSAMHRGQGMTFGNVGRSNVTLFQPPTGANGQGVLVGDQGTMIRVYLEIRPGLRPTGHGSGVDQNGGRYELFF
ncbi:hypothetical protein SAMN05216387_107103 [Nitrosovibrio tenuis]|uniref:Uncharacterized protein n=1 Tax=Nitrosovibrio tenuis TaxID=1233 RepID=A0A1H7NR82_9PROT|nr:hypothetical protein SAMN05216387_107103 [Nitrosovibrio tenuis]